MNNLLVEVDDAGVGSPVGGIVIAVRRGETFIHDILPVDYFRDEELNSNIKMKVKEIVEKLLTRVNFDPIKDEIHICQGDIFSATREWFKEKGFKFNSTEIRSRLQEYVEMAFDLHLTTLGVPRTLLKTFREYKDYSFNLYKWVLIRKSEREKYVKTLFPSWRKKWSKAKLEQFNVNLRFNKICIECGRKILVSDKAVLIKIIADNKIYKTFAHKNCLE